MTSEDIAVVPVTPDTDASSQVATPDIAAATEPAKVEGQDQGEAAKIEDGDKPAEVNGAPEAYAAFTVPEGFSLEGDRLAAATSLLKELNLSQVGAQKAIEAFCKLDGENSETRQKVLEDATQERREQWGQQAKAQLGTKYDESVVLARSAVAAVNSPELLKAFDEEGWGNHPELIKAFAFFGGTVRGSGLKGLGGEAPTVDRSQIPIEKRLYPNMA